MSVDRENIIPGKGGRERESNLDRWIRGYGCNVWKFPTYFELHYDHILHYKNSNEEL